jgi:hypothetical protein
MTTSTTIHMQVQLNVQREIDQNFESVACNSSKAFIQISAGLIMKLLQTLDLIDILHKVVVAIILINRIHELMSCSWI